MSDVSPTTQATRPSTFTCKVIMAVTGVVFGLFVFVHMLGNLKAWFSPSGFNDYAHWLRTAFMPLLPYEGLLWILRVVLLTCLVLHVWCSLLVRHRGRRHRGRKANRGGLAAKTMLITGVLLLAFLVFHLLDLTLGTVGGPAFRAATEQESFAYQNLVASFSRPWSGGLYLATMIALGLHLVQGLWSTATDLGATGSRLRWVWRFVAYLLALLVVVGNATLPIGVWMGALR